MVWNALQQSIDAPLLALIPTTLDRIVVWGALALVIGLIAWREYTLPEVPLQLPAPDPGRAVHTHSAAEAGTTALLPGVAPGAAPPEMAGPRSVA